MQFDLNGVVARVTQRPFNLRFEQSAAVIRELDRLFAAGKAITTSVRLANIGRVVNTTDNSVEIKLNAANQQPNTNPQNGMVNPDSIYEEGELSDADGVAAGDEH